MNKAPAYQRSFRYDYEDIAKITGQKQDTVRQHAHRQKFDPKDLGSVVEYINYIRMNNMEISYLPKSEICFTKEDKP